MHVHKGAWRNLLAAFALATFALPLAATLPAATPVGAQPAVGNNPSSINTTGALCTPAVTPGAAAGTATSIANDPNCYVGADPALAFNLVGSPHTVTFTCGQAVGPAAASGPAAGVGAFPARAPRPTDLSGGALNAGAGVVPGCYDVSASVVDESGGSPNFTSATCGHTTATLNGGTANCAGYQSPLCPVGTYTVAAPCDTTDPTAPLGSQMRVTINPGAPHSYLITFTGYTPLLGTCAAVTAAGTCTTGGGPGGAPCPTGFTYVPGPHTLTTSTNAAPFQASLVAPDGVCQFSVAVEKKYVEITSLTLVPLSTCATASAPFTLYYSEALKGYFGTPCTVVALATGEVVLKAVGNCAVHPNGSSAAAPYGDFPAGSTYQCVGGNLSVIIPNIGNGSTITTATGTVIATTELNSGPVPIFFPNTGSAAVFPTTPTPTIGGLCSGVGLTGGTVTAGTGSVVTICPVGPGTGTVQACLDNTGLGGAGGAIDTQASVCSNTLSPTFLLPPQRRVVPYVRWAGEKQVLTKCFGGAGLMAGQPVEFTLEGAGSNPAQATLIPANIPYSSTAAPTLASGGGTAIQADQNTVWTVTDVNGCATVILYATGEGAVNVDAAIFSAAPGLSGGNELINEHAFEVFYLKFDHLDLENVGFQTITSATQLASSLTFSANPPSARPFGVATATFKLPGAPGSNPPGPNGYSIALCNLDYVRAMVHGYFELPGDPSGRPATQVAIPGAPTGASASYGLPAGRWVLPEDWPVLATFAGFNSSGNPFDPTISSVYAWDLNSGWVFNPSGERATLCAGPFLQSVNGVLTGTAGPNPNTSGVSNTGAALPGGAINNGFVRGTDETSSIDENPQPVAVSYGPCFSQDKAGVGYQTAPDENAFEGTNSETGEICSAGGSLEGITVGIGPFDITQACTNPGPLQLTPSGASIVTPGAVGSEANFGLAPISSNSTYLPNGTLNEWDAPMPAAPVSFGITSGPGFLDQVNKTGLYRIPTDVTGSDIYPDPFYAEAIPASPLIPPVTNNGGYSWDTFGFHGGTTLGPTTSAGFVAGESTTAPTAAGALALGPCGATTTIGSGFIRVPATGGTPSCFVGTGTTPAATVTAPECAAIGGTFTLVTAGPPAVGSCEIPVAPATAAGGINLTNFGPGCPATVGGVTLPVVAPAAGLPAAGAPYYSVEVANGTGFVVGQTVEVYSTRNGVTSAHGLVLAAVGPGADVATAPGATVLTFSGVPAGLCVPVFQGVFASEQTAVTVPATNAGTLNLSAGTAVSLFTPSGATASTTVAFTSTAANGDVTLYLQGSEALARELGGCLMSRGPVGGPVAFGTCEPADYLPAGTIIVTGPANDTVPVMTAGELFPGNCSPDSSCNQGPYPFWQWVPNPASATGRPQSATVYSDNHGEAIVSLETGVISQLAPTVTACATGCGTSSVTCPTGYNLTPDRTNCILNFATLGTAAAPGGTPFQNILAASKFNAATPGCISTAANGSIGTTPSASATTTATAAATATATTTATATATAVATSTSTIGTAGTAVIGATGPTNGQVCINNLGGIEFGPNATLGVTQIQAVVDYPYTRGLHAPISSGAINKVWTSAWNKSVTVSPTGGIAGPAGTTSYTVTVTATDICGNPIVGEPVNVFALGNAGASVLAPLGNGVPNGTSAATVFLDATGTATLSLEVLNTAIGTQGLVIKAVFPFEKVERFAPVIAGTIPGTTATVLYTPGYNMVGGPPGSNFSAAEALFSYNPATQTYGNATASAQNISSAAPTCTGYFAYFAAATAVNIPVTSTAGQTAACTLQAGFNLVGNPFSSPATLPAGVTAYHFNGTTYDVVSSIPVGGAVFIFNDGTLNTLTLTAT